MSYEFHGVNYVDTGCSVHPACLSCPLPRCKYEPGAKSDPYAERNATIRLLMAQGTPAKDVAAQFGLSISGVRHVVRAA